jgi:hypothetical protein
MGLRDDLTNRVKRPKHGATCTMFTLMESLTSDDREALETALADPSYTGVEIAETLRISGYKVGYWIVNRHRSGMCQCR